MGSVAEQPPSSPGGVHNLTIHAARLRLVNSNPVDGAVGTRPLLTPLTISTALPVPGLGPGLGSVLAELPFEPSNLIAAAGILLIIMGLMSSLRKRRHREATTPRLTPEEQRERNRQLRGMRGDLEELMVEIQQLAQRFGTQLDAKAIDLESKLTEADAKLAALNQAIARLEQAGQLPATPSSQSLGQSVGQPSPPTTAHKTDPAVTTSQPMANGQAEANAGTAESRPRDADPTVAAPAVSPVERSADPPVDPIAAEVHRLADEGLAANDIAAKLSEHIGKVELILALRETG